MDEFSRIWQKGLNREVRIEIGFDQLGSPDSVEVMVELSLTKVKLTPGFLCQLPK